MAMRRIVSVGRPPATSGFRRASPRLVRMVFLLQAGGRVLVTGGAGFIGTTLAR